MGFVFYQGLAQVERAPKPDRQARWYLTLIDL